MRPIYLVNGEALSTSNVAEGSGLYFTAFRFANSFNTAMSEVTTTQIGEGVNLYYTDERVANHEDVTANTVARNTAIRFIGTLRCCIQYSEFP